MLKVKIHGRINLPWLNLQPKHLIVSSSHMWWFDYFPGIQPVNELLPDAEAYIGAISVDLLDVTLKTRLPEVVYFTVKGLLQHRPCNWRETWFGLLAANTEDMPIFDDVPDTKPSRATTSYNEMSFYELCLEESRTKRREEDARLPTNRAFEFL
jgi:hypothetical protein